MSLYNGWNALAIGQAINNLNNRRQEKETSIWNNFAQSLQNEIDENRAKAEERRKKEQAMEYARSAGIDTDKAQFLAGMSPEAIYQHALGLEAEKRAAEREEAIYKRNRKDSEYDRDLAYDRSRTDALFDKNEAQRLADEQAKRARKERIEDMEFSDLNAHILALQQKASLNLADENDLRELAEAKRLKQEWLLKHNDYTQFETSDSGIGTEGRLTKQGVEKALLGLIDEKGEVDPKALADMQEKIIKEHGFDIADNDEIKAVYNLVYQKQKGNPKVRDTKNLGSGGKKTEGDAAAIKAREDEAVRFASEQKKAEAFVRSRDPNAPIPEISEADLKKFPAKLRNNYRRAKERRQKRK